MRTFKKALALLLSVVLVLSVMAVIPVTAAETNISSASQFNSISNNGSYKLTADITITSTLPEKTGITLDGNGHTITLKSTMTSGVFTKLTDSTVKNLTVRGENDGVLNFTASSGGGVGALAGTFYGGTLNNVTNAANITVSSGTAWFGGIVGNMGNNNLSAKDATVTNCVNKGNLVAGGGEYTGGLVGVNFFKTTYTGCRNYGNVHTTKGTANNIAGGIIGFVFSNNSNVSLSNCASFGNITYSGNSPVIGAFIGNESATGLVKSATDCYNFTNVADFGNVAIDVSNTPTTITNASQLSSLTAGGSYVLGAAIECSGGYTLPDGVIINGNGYTITLKNATSGLFKTATNAVIANLNVAGTINASSGSGAIGAFIDSASGSLYINGCSNHANINVTASGYTAVGGFVGTSSAADANFSVCNNYGTITAKNAVGGIVGETTNTTVISSSSNHGALTANIVGGIIGKIASSANSVTVNSSSNYGACASTTTPAAVGICGANEISTGFKMSNSVDYTNDATVQAVTLKLKDEVMLRFYIADAVFGGAEKVVIKTGTDDKVELSEETEVINGVKCRAYNVAIDPTRFGQTIKFSIKVTKGGATYSGTKMYSVKKYCTDTLNNANADPALKRLCVDILNYGAEAQKKAGITTNLVNASLTSVQKELATDSVPTISKTNQYTGTANTAVAEWQGAEITFENGIIPVFKFKAANGISGLSAKVTYGDNKTVTITSFEDLGNKVYSLKLENLSAADFQAPIKVKLEKGASSSQQFTFNIETCAADMIKANNNKALAETVLKYIDAVYRYRTDAGAYDIEKYAAPVWQGDIVYAESAFVRENSKSDSSVAPITLLYPIDEIISVRSSDMKTIYKEGRDYTVDSQGRLVIKTKAEGGTIKTLPYYSSDVNKEAYTYSAVGPYTRDYMKKGDVYYYYLDPMYTADTEGGFVKWNISVTYKHGGTSVITTPTNQSSKFQGLISKLTAGNSIKVVSLGDSITEGCSASANHKAYGGVGGSGWGPKQPAYNVMFCDYLEAAYGVDVTFKNYAIGGTTANQALTNTGAYENNAPIPKVIADNPDIFILAYGMNDGGTDPSVEADRVKQMVDEVQKACPDTYVIVVSTCLLGQCYSTSNSTRLQFGTAFENTFASMDKVVVANVTNADIQMEGYNTSTETGHTGPKVYQDLTGSNSNHPNDFMHRIYLQVIIQSAFGTNKFAQ